MTADNHSPPQDNALKAQTPPETLALLKLHWENYTPKARLQTLEDVLAAKLRTSEKLQALRLAAECYQQLHLPEKQIQTLTTMSELSPHDPWPKLHLAKIYQTTNPNLDKAIQWAEAALKIAPWHGPAKEMLRALKKSTALH